MGNCMTLEGDKDKKNIHGQRTTSEEHHPKKFNTQEEDDEDFARYVNEKG